METKTATAGQNQYLTFCLAGEEYAINILRVTEIIEYAQVNKIPQMPNWIRGVINLRSTVIPVIDLALKFGLPGTKVTKLCCIIIVETESRTGEPMMMGVLAEAVRQVVELTSGDIQRPPAFGTHLRTDFLLGMAKVGKIFALILDIDGVLSADELLAATSVHEPERRISDADRPMSETKPHNAETG
jgi:purine-binding chemotaxis protein CheW